MNQPEKFAAGERVVCVDAYLSGGTLTAGKEYEVAEIKYDGKITVVADDDGESALAYHPSRFRRAPASDSAPKQAEAEGAGEQASKPAIRYFKYNSDEKPHWRVEPGDSFGLQCCFDKVQAKQAVECDVHGRSLKELQVQESQRAEAVRDINHVIKTAKECCPDYPWQHHDLREACWALSESLKGSQLANEDLHKEIATLTAELAQARRERDDAKKLNAALRQNLIQATSDADANRRMMEQARRELDMLDASHTRQADLLIARGKELTAKQSELDAVKEQNAALLKQ